MSYCLETRVRIQDCDLYDRLRPAAVMDAMQEAAIAHCESADLGRAVTDAMGVVWVLSRCRVELSRAPGHGERMCVETFAMPTRHLFFPRGYVLRDAADRVIGGAHALWLLMDVRTRRAVMEKRVVERLPIEEREAPCGIPASVRPLNDAPTRLDIAPRFTEFDLNGHVNNARYLDWCWNALGFDALRDRSVAAFDVNYESEILPDERVEGALCRDGDAFTFLGASGVRRCFSIGGTLRETGG